MNQSFYTAVSGAKSYQSGIDVTSTNIANVNTVGYRGATAEFSNLFSKVHSENSQTLASDVGYGSTVSTTSLDLREGGYTSTENTFDLAISGEGWFGVSSSNIFDAKEAGYTRNGVFNSDVDSHLVNTSGNYLLGTNFNNIVADGDKYKIDLNVAEPTPSVSAQTKLFVPENLIYPAVASTQINITSNLEGGNTLFTPSQESSNLAANFDSSGELLNIKDGENLIMVVGEGDYSASSNSLKLDLNFSDELLDGNNSALSFELNGQTIAVTIPDGTKANDVTNYINNAIINANVSGITTTRVSDNNLAMTSNSTINISNSSHQGIIKNSGGTLATFKENKTSANEFSNLQDLKNIINNGINSIQSSSADVFTTANGELKIVANDSFSFKLLQTDNSNEKLLNMLNPLSSSYIASSSSSTSNFQTKEKILNTNIVTPNGETKQVQVKFSQTDTENSFGGDSWQLNGSLFETSGLQGSTDLSNLLDNNSPVNLVDGNDVWIRGGTTAPTTTDNGYGYKFSLNSDPLDGASSNISFNINGENINLNILDGATQESIAKELLATLESRGFSGTIDEDNNLTIDAKDSKLIIKNGSSTLKGVTVDNFVIQKLTYDSTSANGFKTTEEFTSQINQALNEINLSASLSNNRLNINNNSSSDNFFSFLSGDNTNTDFFKTINSLGGAIDASSSIASNTLQAHNTLSSNSIELNFKNDGNLASNYTFSLDNNGENINIDLNNLISSSANEVITDSIRDNGIKEGSFSGYSVEENGEIRAAFDNKETVTVGKVAIFHFQNDQGLERIGDNLFKSSNNSGDPLFYVDAEGNVIDSSIIRDKTLETSNISSSTALTELILYQRSFEGASRAITTSDQMLQQAINMKK